MGTRHAAGAALPELARPAVPLLREAERGCSRTGPGAELVVPDRVVAAWIMIALVATKKSRSAQYHYLCGRRAEIAARPGGDAFLARAGYFRRHRRCHRLYQAAVKLQGARAVAEGVAHPRHVAVDKGMPQAAGPLWYRRDRRAGEACAGVSVEGAWGYSEHGGRVYGYSYEVVVVAAPRQVVFPLPASVDAATAGEAQTFAPEVADPAAGDPARVGGQRLRRQPPGRAGGV